MYKLPSLTYSYDALEPYIDARTMEIHHTKHHQGYIDKLNAALEEHSDLAEKPVEELLRNLASMPQDIQAAIRNHGGGHANHSLFWQLMTPDAQLEPTGELKNALNEAFGDFTRFKEVFTVEAVGRFGSGWAWLVLSKGQLKIYSTANQDSPLSLSDQPILGLDVWEHAYYLNYQNRRSDYITAFWNVVNWKKVEELYQKAK